MAVDIKKLIAAINPALYCDSTPDEKGKRLSDVVKEIVKKEGYLKAAEKAKLRESDYVDVVHTAFTKGVFALEGMKAPIESHALVYDAFSQNLEPIYFWILDYINGDYGESDKLIDNFTSSPGSGHFAEMSRRATVLQDEAMKIFGTVNTVMKSVLNIIYDLREFKIRLEHYEKLKYEDKRVREAATISLKQIWMDNVDIKRGAGSLNGLAQQLEFITIRDAFMAANSLKDVENLDLNERVKRILKARYAEFERWIAESERELRKRFEIEKTYLKTQVNTIKIYARWVKPLLKSARQLEQNAAPNASIVNAFNTSLFELTLFGKGRYEPKDDVAKGNLPKIFNKLKLRAYFPVVLVEFVFRVAPDRTDQRGGYGFRGKIDVKFTSFSLNEDEIAVLKQEIEKDDFGEVYKMITGATDESLAQINDDLDELLDVKKEKKEEESSDDSNPFTALFSFLKSDEKKSEKADLSKGIPKDNDYEKALRNQTILLARFKCRKLYDTYKKAHDMPAFRPVVS